MEVEDSTPVQRLTEEETSRKVCIELTENVDKEP
jgi:hypothetical protein